MWGTLPLHTRQQVESEITACQTKTQNLLQSLSWAQAAIQDGQEAVSTGAWNVTNGNGPLHLAASNGRAQLVELLLQAGAPVDAPDGDGATALQVVGTSMWPDRAG
jgi:Ankyrin repeats (many copies)